jgi:diguanylate cyclase (GGDEF)-like protein
MEVNRWHRPPGTLRKWKFWRPIAVYGALIGYFSFFITAYVHPMQWPVGTWAGLAATCTLFAVTYHARNTAAKYLFLFAAFLLSLYLLSTGDFDLVLAYNAMYLSLILYAALLPHAFGSFFLLIGYVWWMLRYSEHVPAEHLGWLIAEFLVLNALLLIIRVLQRQRDAYRHKSNTEPMTGLFAKEFFLQIGGKWLEERKPIRILIVHIERFTQVNETYGHAVGDAVIKQVSNVLLELALLNGGVASRIGVIEFAILVPDHPRTAGLSERIRLRLQSELVAANPELSPLSLQYYIGEAIGGTAARRSIEDLLQEADVRMNDSKLEYINSLLDRNVDRFIPYPMVRHLLQSMGEKDIYTFIHSKRAAETGLRFGERLGLCEEMLGHLVMACWLHDCGKMFLPSYLLLKQGSLTEEECTVVQAHVDHGVRMLSGIGVPAPVLQAISEHHERWDGNGYPAGTQRNDQSRIGRILQLVEAYAAMTVRNSCRKPCNASEALDEIEHGAGTRFDPALAAEFVRLERGTVGIDGGIALPLASPAL